MSNSKTITEAEWTQLTAVLGQEPAVMAAWVFGSAAAGEIRAGGDFDVGVLWRQKPSLDQLLHLQSALQAVLNFEEIDLVTLNDASSILRFEAVSGRHIYSADAGETAVFVSMTAREYEDDMAMIQRALATSA